MHPDTEAAISRWLNYLSINRARYTLRAYRAQIERLVKTAPDRAPHAWTCDDLAAYVAGMRANGLTNSYIKQCLCAARSFFGFVRPEDNPAARLPFPKVHNREQRALKAYQLLELLTVQDTSTVTGRRNVALVALLADTGLRASEVCNLQLADVDLDNRRLTATIKGGGQGVGVFSETTRDILRLWLDTRPAVALPATATLFCSVGGNTRGKPLTRDGLRVIMRYMGRLLGVKLSAHDFRRTMATLATRNGAPARVLQVAGRWSDIKQVERYTASITAEDFDRYSPVHVLLGRQ